MRGCPCDIVWQSWTVHVLRSCEYTAQNTSLWEGTKAAQAQLVFIFRVRANACIHRAGCPSVVSV